MKAYQPSPESPPTRRGYRLGARAEAAEAAGERMVTTFVERLESGWFEDIRLDDIAREAGVSVQTVIRRFGSKEGLLAAAVARIQQEVATRREVVPGHRREALTALLDDYEQSGDMVVRVLAQEERQAVFPPLLKLGRDSHREWLAESFAPELAAFPPAEREHRLDALVAATDVYVWKVLRRDMKRSPETWLRITERFVAAALDTS